MTKILNFHNEGGTYNDNSESVITISPEGTKVEQHLHQQVSEEKSASRKRADGLTISQQVLLFSELLDVGLNPTYENQSQLAEFIAKVTGGNPESIRQKIIDIGKMSDYTRQVKIDAELVAKLLEPYKPKLATDLRNFYIDE